MKQEETYGKPFKVELIIEVLTKLARGVPPTQIEQEHNLPHATLYMWARKAGIPLPRFLRPKRDWEFIKREIDKRIKNGAIHDSR